MLLLDKFEVRKLVPELSEGPRHLVPAYLRLVVDIELAIGKHNGVVIHVDIHGNNCTALVYAYYTRTVCVGSLLYLKDETQRGIGITERAVPGTCKVIGLGNGKGGHREHGGDNYWN